MDRNNAPGYLLILRVASLSARRAWIEILYRVYFYSPFRVALRKESVDRNTGCSLLKTKKGGVALRKESVDRNSASCPRVSAGSSVALRKESVDRNLSLCSRRLAA